MNTPLKGTTFHSYCKNILLINFFLLSAAASAKGVNDIQGDYRIRDNNLQFYAQIEADQSDALVLSELRNADLPSQKWRLEQISDNTYYIKSTWSERYMTAINGGPGSDVVTEDLNTDDDASQQWLAEAADDCTYRFKNKLTGLYLNSHPNQSTAWKQREFETTWLSMRFRLEPLGSQLNTTICDSENGTNDNLLFKSGFEGNVHVTEGSIDDLRPSAQTLKGQDADNKANWFRTLKDAGLIDDGFFQYTVGGGVDPNTWITTKFVNTQNKDGDDTRALHLGVKGLKEDSPFTTRNEYNFYPSDSWIQAYAKFDVKIQDNFMEGPDTWYNFMEWKEPKGPLQESGEVSGSNRYRNTIYIERDNDDLFWRLQTQLLDPEQEYLYTEYSHNSPIRIGEWNKVEVFWKYSENGRIWLRVNDVVVFDYWGSTVHPTYEPDLLFWAPFKNYRGSEWFDSDLTDGDETWALYDNFEIWRDFPE